LIRDTVAEMPGDMLRAIDAVIAERNAEIEGFEAEIAKLRERIAEIQRERQAAEQAARKELAEIEKKIAANKPELDRLREALLKDPLNQEIAARYKEAADKAEELEMKREEEIDSLRRMGVSMALTNRYLHTLPEQSLWYVLQRVSQQRDVAESTRGTSAEELRRLIAAKETELVELRKEAARNAERMREIERAIEALRAGLKALERAEESASDTTEYTVKEGDSWWRLANVTFKDRGLSSQDLQQANPGVQLRPGAVIRIPARGQ
jgi:DNA repair exonuclease SbcCD ATPase subunit